MKHLDRQVLSPGVVQGDAAIDTARHEQVSIRAICDLCEGFIKLREFIRHTGSLDVEDSHHT